MEEIWIAIFAVILELALIPSIIWGAKYIAHKQDEKYERLNKLEAGMLATLRQQYLTTAFAYIEKGYVPFAIADSMEQIYQAYHALGGNGTVTSTRETFIQLPRRV